MNYSQINRFDVANGPGVRVSLFVSGCRLHCKNCFNKAAQDFNYGKEFDRKAELIIINNLANGYYSGLTILGGEPLEPENAKILLPFLKNIKTLFPSKTIWLYSGYSLVKNKINNIKLKDLYGCIDVLVDGPFVEDLKDATLKFKGSSNQRLIDINETFKCKKLTLLN